MPKEAGDDPHASEVRAALEGLLDFATQHQLIQSSERLWARNLLLDALHYDAPPEGKGYTGILPQTATVFLQALCDDAVVRGLLADTAANRDLFTARLMGLLTPQPALIRLTFDALRTRQGIRAATDWFYSLCRANDYIRVDAVARNVRFPSPSPYGDLEITINLSKPEKDPKDIAALLTKPSVAYPKCMLCPENQGYAGRLDFPARQNHRLLPLTLCGERYDLQYSPYLYYTEHAIILNQQHIPMVINRDTFARLLDFLDQFPHYFIGSNADLPIVGGSILNHDHFQGGRYHFPMEKAPVYAQMFHAEFSGITCGLVQWPLSTIRLQGHDQEALISLAERILSAWRGYSDPSLEVHAFTGDLPHNTITPIARKKDQLYELDLVLRNNRTTQDLPLGIFHPHPDLHHIKKENIGLIEVMGLFILPGRLKQEISGLVPYLLGEKLMENEQANPLQIHFAWIADLQKQNPEILSKADAEQVLRDGLGQRCTRVLEDAGVFKLDEAGKAGMERFAQSLGFVFA